MVGETGGLNASAIDDAPRDGEGMVAYMQRVPTATLRACWQALVIDECTSDRPSLSHLTRMLAVVQQRLVDRLGPQERAAVVAGLSPPPEPLPRFGRVPKGEARKSAINRLTQIPIGRPMLVAELPRRIGMPRNEMESLRVGIIQGAKLPDWLKVSYTMSNRIRRWRVERVADAERVA